MPSTTPSWSSGPPTYTQPGSPAGYGTQSGGYPAGGAPSGGYSSGGFPAGGVASGGYPPAGPPSGGYGPPPSSSNRGVLYAVLGGVAAVALIVVLIVASSGGGDDDTAGSTTTTRNSTTTSQQTTSTSGLSTTSSSTAGTVTDTTVDASNARRIANLMVSCSDGNMVDCDDVWSDGPVGTELETFAETCGNRDPGGSHVLSCEADFGADGSGAPSTTTSTMTADQSSQLDACIGGGDMAACDGLYAGTPYGSLLDTMANVCGGINPGGAHNGNCEDTYG